MRKLLGMTRIDNRGQNSVRLLDGLKRGYAPHCAPSCRTAPLRELRPGRDLPGLRSPRTVRKLVADGKLSVYRCGAKIVRVDLDEIDRVMSGGGVGQSRPTIRDKIARTKARRTAP